MGDIREAAAAIRLLAGQPARLRNMAAAARSHNRKHFSIPTMAAHYTYLLESMMTRAPDISAPLPVSDWKYPKGLRAGLRSYLPQGVQNLLREMRERFA